MAFELKRIIHLVEVIEVTLEEKDGWSVNLIKQIISGKGSDMMKAPKEE